MKCYLVKIIFVRFSPCFQFYNCFLNHKMGYKDCDMCIAHIAYDPKADILCSMMSSNKSLNTHFQSKGLHEWFSFWNYFYLIFLLFSCLFTVFNTTIWCPRTLLMCITYDPESRYFYIVRCPVISLYILWYPVISLNTCNILWYPLWPGVTGSNDGNNLFTCECKAAYIDPPQTLQWREPDALGYPFLS